MPKLIDAVMENDFKKVKKLLERRPIFGGYKGDAYAINQEKDEGGGTALYRACEYGFLKIAKLLMKHGATLKNENAFGVAATNEHIKIMKFLLKNGESIESPWLPGGESTLYRCCFLGKEKSVKFLIRNGANVNYLNYQYESPLHAAVNGLHPNICKILLENGASIDLRSKDWETPYEVALRLKNQEIINIFNNYKDSFDLISFDNEKTAEPILHMYESRKLEAKEITGVRQNFSPIFD